MRDPEHGEGKSVVEFIRLARTSSTIVQPSKTKSCYNVMGFVHLLVPILCVADHGKNVRQGCGLKEVAHGEACYQVRSRKPSKEWISMSLTNGWVWPVKALMEKSVCHMISVVVNEDSV